MKSGRGRRVLLLFFLEKKQRHQSTCLGRNGAVEGALLYFVSRDVVCLVRE